MSDQEPMARIVPKWWVSRRDRPGSRSQQPSGSYRRHCRLTCWGGCRDGDLDGGVRVCAFALRVGSAERPHLGIPPSQVRPLWGARLPSVGGAPKGREGDFARGQSRCQRATGTVGGPAARRGMRAAEPQYPGWPRGRPNSRTQQARRAAVARSMGGGVSTSRRPTTASPADCPTTSLPRCSMPSSTAETQAATGCGSPAGWAR